MRNAWDKIAEQIPPNSMVLDVGCGYGDLAKRLIDKGCMVYGVDIEPERLAKAESYYKEVARVDLEKDEIVFKERERNLFEVVVLADVLEHILSGEMLLNKVKRYLSEDGMLVVSLPNIAHWTIRKQLLCGRFEYTEYGIMDKTHIHFYTLRSAVDSFKKCGYKVIKMDHTTNGIPFIGSILKLLPFGKSVTDGLYKKYPSLLGYQFIFSLIPE